MGTRAKNEAKQKTNYSCMRHEYCGIDMQFCDLHCRSSLEAELQSSEIVAEQMQQVAARKSNCGHIILAY